ncbi:MAG: hypothetical protein QMD71_05680 [bacterium]|nr:hypothetical protein [bacterium]
MGAGGQEVLLIKRNSDGGPSWWNYFGGSGDDCGYGIQQTTDAGYIIVGYTASYGEGGKDIWLIKTDTGGDTLWTRTFGGPYSDEGHLVKQTADGGYIIVDSTYSYGAGISDV